MGGGRVSEYGHFIRDQRDLWRSGDTLLVLCGRRHRLLTRQPYLLRGPEDRHVVVIETAVRNIPVAILVGSSMATNPIYFLLEVVIMIPYALWVRSRSERP